MSNRRADVLSPIPLVPPRLRFRTSRPVIEEASASRRTSACLARGSSSRSQDSASRHLHPVCGVDVTVAGLVRPSDEPETVVRDNDVHEAAGETGPEEARESVWSAKDRSRERVRHRGLEDSRSSFSLMVPTVGKAVVVAKVLD